MALVPVAVVVVGLMHPSRVFLRKSADFRRPSPTHPPLLTAVVYQHLPPGRQGR